ncbi:hypothetical protein TOPH_04731 [Tolypocladium ophioglossoides CBS 100239]|uniref:Uncharacterized protein n=1 Tax=Tolypocladium ophioglossoides (strain CBS 100239) TaxID=1163406 RepID=A0A0L0NA40_TOLOC|nr:hypothetical protein TOPH_04731 [Tolypocladium ophioglossoides CBS 100239]
MSPWEFPNVMQVDYIGVMLLDNQANSLTDDNSLSLDLATLCYGINLYLLSENCDISPSRSPLLPSQFKPRPSKAASKATWNGMMYANGTVDEPGRRRLSQVVRARAEEGHRLRQRHRREARHAEPGFGFSHGKFEKTRMI